MLRVLVLCEHPTVLGGERSWLATVDAVRAAGISITVAAPSKGPLAEVCRQAEMDLIPFDSLDEQGRRLDQTQRRELLETSIRRFRPGLVHANSLSMGRLVGPVARSLGIPSIAHLRDIIRLSARAMADLNENGRLLAVSKATADYHVAGGLDPEKTFVLYNGVDLKQFQPRASTGFLHRELGLSPEARLVGTVGQIGLRKGHDVLLDAAVEVCRKNEGVHFALVGQRWSTKEESRRFEAALREKAAETGGRFHFLGVREDVAKLMNEWTLLAHPARQEPLGRVLLEAAASGLPVVATDVGGTAEIFPPETESARLIPPDDPTALARAIETVLENPDEQARLARAARQQAETQFDARRSSAGLIDHYRQAAQR